VTAALLTPLPEGRKPRRDDVFECVVTKLRRRGGAEGEWGPFKVELRRGVPGERLLCQVTKRRGELVRARILEVLAPSPDAVEPECAHFASCGGCSFQDSAYELQLREAHARLADLLLPVLDGSGVTLEPVVAAGPTFGYRNKMDFTFGAQKWVELAHGATLGDAAADAEPASKSDSSLPGERRAEGGVQARQGGSSSSALDDAHDFALGLHAPGRHDKVLDIQHCAIAFPEASEILNVARELALEHGLAPWDLSAHTGLLRHLVVRKGFRTGEVLVYLVTSTQAGVEQVSRRAGDDVEVGPYARALLERVPAITTLVHGMRDGISSVAVGERDVVLHGPGVIHEVLGGVRFELSARAFFQTNTAAAERLFELVAAEACPTQDEVVYDLYCGAGTIALLLAPHCREVVGFEVVEQAVVDARRNAERAGIANARFVAGDARFTASANHVRVLGLPQPDVVVVDPPRAGLHPDVTAFLVELAVPRLVYVSCNPKAAAGDLARLVEGGYRIERAVPVDLFPHTPHVECVFTLTRAEGTRVERAPNSAAASTDAQLVAGAPDSTDAPRAAADSGIQTTPDGAS